MFSSMGLPGLNGFVGEFLILLGAWRANPLYAILAATGVILAAIYLLWMYERVMQGQVTNEKNVGLPDLSAREVALLVALVIFMVALGVYPRLLLDPMQASVANITSKFIVGLIK
jgi:NADH-quinone oxidoreductase subunit M